MKIAFDIQPLLNSGKSGVGFHTDGLIRNIIEKYPENHYYLELFTKKNRERKIEIANSYKDKKSYVTILECKWFPGTIYRMLYHFIHLPYQIFFKESVDITHFFNFCIPPGVQGKKVVTIHDMAMKRYPETVRFKTKILLRLSLKKTIKRADAIIAVSEFTKQEIMHFYKVPDKKIHVVPNGVDFSLFHTEYSTERVEEIKEQYGIKGDYFLYLGTVEPRKNLIRLIEAYYILLQKNKEKIPVLVLAGGKGWLDKDIFLTIERLKIKEKIIFTGYLKNKDVPVLMKGAKVFCFPSLYEGFGMPVLEAMACGTPVLTSNTTALSEIVGDVAVKVDCHNVMEIEKGLELLNINNEMRQKLSQNGIERARTYSWDRAVQCLEKVYKSIYF